MQNLVVVSHTICAHVGGPKNSGGRWSSAPLGGGERVADDLETFLTFGLNTMQNLVYVTRTVASMYIQFPNNKKCRSFFSAQLSITV